MRLSQSESKGVLMKGLRFVQDEKPAGERQPTLNASLWARQTAGELTCQEAIDAKAFTGRGSLRELRQMIAGLDEVEQRMYELSSTSKALIDTRLYLVVHQRSSTGYMFLRWRERAGGNRHLPWERSNALIEAHSPPQRRWCTEATEYALALNQQHLTLRERLKAMRQQLLQSASHVYPRPLLAATG